MLNKLLHFYINSIISNTVQKINLFFLILKNINLIIISLAMLYQTEYLFFLALNVTIINSIRIFWLIPKRLYKLKIIILYNDILNITLPDPNLFSEMGLCKNYTFRYIGYNHIQKDYYWIFNEYTTPFYKKINNYIFFFQLVVLLLFSPCYLYNLYYILYKYYF